MQKINGIRKLEQILRQLLRRRDWALLDCRITGFESSQDIYGTPPTEILRFTELLLSQVLEEIGTPDDVLCVADDGYFAIITTETNAIKVKNLSKTRFEANISTNYSSLAQNEDKQEVPSIKLAVGVVTSRDLFSRNANVN